MFDSATLSPSLSLFLPLSLSPWPFLPSGLHVRLPVSLSHSCSPVAGDLWPRPAVVCSFLQADPAPLWGHVISTPTTPRMESRLTASGTRYMYNIFCAEIEPKPAHFCESAYNIEKLGIALGPGMRVIEKLKVARWFFYKRKKKYRSLYL